MAYVRLDEYDGIQVGDTVRCSPVGALRFRAVVQYIRQREDGHTEVSVVGGRSGVRQWRTFTPDRITVLDQ